MKKIVYSLWLCITATPLLLHATETLKITTTDNAEFIYKDPSELAILKLSATIRHLLKTFNEEDRTYTIQLPENAPGWRATMECLQLLDALAQSEGDDIAYKEQKLLSYLRDLDTPKLYSLIKITNFLEVPKLLDTALDVLVTQNVLALRDDQLSSLFNAPLATPVKEKIKGFIVHSCRMNENNPIAGKKIMTDYESIHALCYRPPDGKDLACVDHNGKVRVYNTDTGDIAHEYEGYHTVCYNPDGTVLATVSKGGMIYVRNAVTGLLLKALIGHTDIVKTLSFDHDGSMLASGSNDTTIRIWNPQTSDKTLHVLNHPASVFSVHYSPDGTSLVSGSADYTVRIWDALKGELMRTLDSSPGVTFAVRYSPNGKLIAAGTYNRAIHLWHAQTGTHAGTLRGHENSVLALHFSPDSQFLVSGSMDNMVYLWHIATRKQIRTFNNHTGWVNTVCFSPDGTAIASGSSDQTLCMFDFTRSMQNLIDTSSDAQLLLLWALYTKKDRDESFNLNQKPQLGALFKKFDQEKQELLKKMLPLQLTT